MLVTATGLELDYDAGIGPDSNFISLRAGINGLQIDDQLATSRFPVVLTQASVDSDTAGVAQPLVQACVICQPGGAQGQVRLMTCTSASSPGRVDVLILALHFCLSSPRR